MRWVTNRDFDQYLVPEDFPQFVRAVAAAAGRRSSVGVYIASDSHEHIARIKNALLAVNSDWNIHHAPFASHTSDASTYDALFDALVLAQCDDFIATAGSTFSHLAAALGALVPIVIGGSV
jgi:hypothetical protein